MRFGARWLLAVGFLGLLPGAAIAEDSTSVRGFPSPSDQKLISAELNPLALYTQLSFAVSDRVTVGPSLSLVRLGWGFLSDVTYRGFTLGIQSTIYLSDHRHRDGWIVSPFVGYYSYNVQESIPDIFNFGDEKRAPSVYSGDFRGSYAGAVAGYRWVWEEGITLSVGGGFTAYSRPRSQTLTSSDGSAYTRDTLYGGVNPALMTNIGYVF